MNTRFILQPKTKTLLVENEQDTDNATTWQFSYEYLRVFSIRQAANKTVIANKKQVALENIEHVGKHGYRFIFDDNHSCIFELTDLADLHKNYENNWQNYLTSLLNNNLSREAKIDIVNLS